MTATQVFGQRAGKFAALRAKQMKHIGEQINPSENIRKWLHQEQPYKDNEFATSIVEDLREKFSREAMVHRNESGLTSCLSAISQAKEEIIERRQDYGPLNLKKLNMLVAMELITKAALQRRESLGSHYRSDYPPEFPS